MDELFRISNCKTATKIWDTLETTHEGIEELKQSRFNTLSQEYKKFRMLLGGRILDMQKTFTHLTNGKTLTNNDFNLKILKSLIRAWQPKVTSISKYDSDQEEES